MSDTPRSGMKLGIGLVVGFVLAWASMHAAALVPRAFDEGDPPGFAPPTAREGSGVTVSFVDVATASVPGYRLAQGLGLAGREVRFRAALVEHPDGNFLFNVGPGVDAPGPLSFRPGQPFGRISPLDGLDRLLDEVEVERVIVSSARFYNAGDIGRFDVHDVWIANHERWASTRGPYPARLGVDVGHAATWVDQANVIPWDGRSVLGFRKTHDVFGDGSVWLIALRGSTWEEVAALVTLDSGRQVLLVSDSVWVREQVVELRPRFAALTYTHDQQRMKLMAMQQRLHALVVDHGLEVVPLHDGEVRLPAYPERWE